MTKYVVSLLMLSSPIILFVYYVVDEIYGCMDISSRLIIASVIFGIGICLPLFRDLQLSLKGKNPDWCDHVTEPNHGAGTYTCEKCGHKSYWNGLHDHNM